MKRRNVILMVLILALVLSAGIGSAWAYFTSFAAAKGGIPLELGYRTEFEEKVEGARKDVTITYDAADGKNQQEVYVRVRAWSPDETKYPLSYEYGEGWQNGGDGWWYYMTPLGPENQNAADFAVLIGGLTEADTEGLEKPKDGDSLNVVVVYECAPVLYKPGADGKPVPVEATDPSIWEQKLITGDEAPEAGPEGGD